MTITLDKNHSDLPALRAVCAALGKDATRPALTHLLIGDNCAVAIDGHRMHIAKLCDTIPDGLYQVVKSTKTSFVAIPSTDLTVNDFPSYKRAIPEKTACGAEVILVGDVHHDLAACIRALPEDRCVNIDYFCDALALFPDGCTVAPGTVSLRMEDTGGRLAVIVLLPIKEH